MFLIFDVELVLIFPVVLSVALSGFIGQGLILSTFLGVLLVGLYYEANQGRLGWAK